VPERARQVRTFEAGLELFRRIAAVAEAEGHHPDLHLEGYNHAYAQLSTHSVGARRVWLAGDACVDGLPELGGAPDARPLSPQAVWAVTEMLSASSARRCGISRWRPPKSAYVQQRVWGPGVGEGPASRALAERCIARARRAGGLTENDFILAAKINALQLADLLPKAKPRFWAWGQQIVHVGTGSYEGAAGVAACGPACAHLQHLLHITQSSFSCKKALKALFA